MAQAPGEKQEAEATLSDRIQAFRREIQSLVAQGAEHPRFEFKRSCSIIRENLDDRLDFVKLLQGIANSSANAERCIVIGADPKAKEFCPVSNFAEFDWAAVSALAEKYLDPVPQFEVFNNLQTDAGVTFVLIVLGAVQPQPVLIKTEGAKADGKTRLRVGEIWIKRGTALQTATRADLNSMYRQQMEAEAEARARERFKHFTDLSRSTHAAGIATRLPSRELLVGPVEDFQVFVEELIAADDRVRFRMLVELIQEPLTDGWRSLDARVRASSGTVQEYVTEANKFFRDEFLPSLQSLVSVGLLIIKHDCHAEWLQSVVDSVVDAFEGSRHLQGLKSGYVAQGQDPLPWWRPASEIYVALKCIASYAILRKRLRFLGSVMPRMVARISVDDRKTMETPVLFWPFEQTIFEGEELNDGRSTFFWKERVSAAWGKYFATPEKYLGAACQLEFLLEFNSYLGINSAGDPKIAKWLEINAEGVSYIYVPDLYTYELYRTAPMAEACYDFISSDEPFPEYLTVEPSLFKLAFSGKTRDERLLIYGGFLYHLKTWQGKVRFHNFRLFPFTYNWPGRLLQASDRYQKIASGVKPAVPG